MSPDARPQRTATVLTLATALLLAGCGSRDQTVTAQEQSASAAAASETAAAESAAASAAEAAASQSEADASASASESASASASATLGGLVQPSDQVEVTGEVMAAAEIHREALAALPQQTVEIPGPNGERHVMSGPLLVDVLAKAGLRTDEANRNDLLRLAVVAVGSDGYEVVLSYGEFSPDFGGRPTIIAIVDNGQTPDGGLRLVVSGDPNRDRTVPGLVELRVVRVG